MRLTHKVNKTVIHVGEEQAQKLLSQGWEQEKPAPAPKKRAPRRKTTGTDEK